MILSPHQERPGMWVSAFVLSGVLHAGLGAYFFDLSLFDVEDAPVPMAFPEIAISNILLQQLELAALEPERETLQPVQPNNASQAAVETLEPVAPDEQDSTTEAERLDAAEPETLEAVEVDEASAPEPETLEPSAAEEVVQGSDAETPDTPDVAEVAPTEPAETAAPAEPARVTPVLPDTTTTVVGTTAPVQSAEPAPRVTAVTPTNTDVARVEAVTPDQSVQTAAIAPTVQPSVTPSVQNPPAQDPIVQPAAQPPAPAPAPAPSLTAEDLVMLELIERIRTRFEDNCLIALPQNRGRGSDPFVTLVSDQDRSMSQFTADVLSDPALPVENQQVLVDTRQCAALEFSRARDTYPTFRVRLGLRTPIVNSGERLRGTIGNIGGRFTSLLIVDDNGVVQDLRRFTRFTAGSAEFDVPVTRDGDARDTSQLLIAITSNGAPITIRERAGRLAEDFFHALNAELGDAASIAILPFFVR